MPRRRFAGMWHAKCSMTMAAILFATVGQSPIAHGETPNVPIIYDMQRISDMCGDYRNNIADQDICTFYLIGVVEGVSGSVRERDRILSCAIPMRYLIFEKFKHISQTEKRSMRPSYVLVKAIDNIFK